MTAVEDILADLDRFKDDYIKSLERYIDEIQVEIDAAYEFALVKEEIVNTMISVLEKLKTLNTPFEKLKYISEAKMNLEQHHPLKITSKKQLRKKKKKTIHDHFVSVQERIGEVKNFFTQQRKQIAQKAGQILKEIQECPFGKRKEWRKNSLYFQNKVTELLAWSFIDELELLPPWEFRGRLKIDAVFKVNDSVKNGLKDRWGLQFDHLFVECKNYKRPDYKDLMQLFAYSLFCEASDISKIPLGILISRENPGSSSAASKIREIIFLKKMGEESRLMLFLDLKDLQIIVNCLEKGNPAEVIKNKREDLSHSFIGRR